MKKFLTWIANKFANINKKKLAITAGVLAFLLVIAWAFIAAEVITKNFNRGELIGTENKQGIDVHGLILTETKNNTKYWEIFGMTGTYSSDEKVALLDTVTGNFYKDNEVAMSFESSKGTYNETKGQIVLYTNTFIVLKDGTTLTCDRLIWSGSDKPIRVEGNVKINRKNELISTANEAIISSDYTDFTIKGKANTKLYKKKSIALTKKNLTDIPASKEDLSDKKEYTTESTDLQKTESGDSDNNEKENKEQ